MDQRTRALGLRLEGNSYNLIGKILKVSRQRAYQILTPPPAIRDLVVRRAKGCCEKCGMPVGVSGDVHHKASTGLDCDQYHDTDNLALLCRPCHRSVHRGALRRQRTVQSAQIGTVEVMVQQCPRTKCRHEWQPRVKRPKKCPSCGQPLPKETPR